MGTGCKRSVRRGSPSLPAAIMMLGRGLDARDNQTRQVREAVSNVEKHFGELCQIFAAYVRKTARLRDKADLLVNEIYAYAATETPSLKLGLKNFADEFSKLQDYRQAEVERLEARVVDPLKSYGTIVKLKRVFRSSLYPPDYQSRLDIVRANSKSPLQRTGSSKFSSGIIQQISTSRLRKEEEDEEDDDELEATKEEREL
ncbi:hypothetical protein KIL84_011229 [Mauremys mutica]|uniref:Uncharacterized protein n=1 Tax=Mauremys mutica TaxID=74926 RepID=A0A9D3XDE1_9SAUR|nr:hypothetical protein KIL84_011229 [Mauremys mutica]